MKNLKQERVNTVLWTNDTGSAVSSGGVAVMGNQVGVAKLDIANGSAGAVMREGIFERLAADNTTAFTAFSPAWWDASAAKFYNVAAAGRVYAGVFSAAKASSGTTCEVLLLPNQGDADDEAIALGAAADAQILWSTGDASNHTTVFALGDSNQALHITDVGAKATDWNVAADTHPTVYVHSNTTPATDYLKIGGHDGSAAWGADMVGGGTLNFGFDGLEALVLVETASAVNHLQITNAATGGTVAIAAAGDDTDIGLSIAAKGAGDVTITSGDDMTLSAGQAASDVMNLRAYDVDGAAYKNMIAITSGNTPSVAIGTAATDLIGLFGATPVAQQLKASHNNWSAVSDVVAALVNLGLFDQS